jgi:energy-coupling factor transporter ATP-binding protein EcfA2
MIDLEHVTVRFGQHVGLDEVSVEIRQGEFVLVTGPSGCGKSTLTRCLNGLIPLSVRAEMSGRVTIDGRATSGATVADLATSVGLVFQNPATQLFCLTVGEEVEFGPRNLGLAEAEIARRASWAIGATGITALRDRPVGALSGGEQQRVAIAAVLAMKPRMLVLDEPTSSLDMRGRKALMATLQELGAANGMTILVVEHRLGEVARLARRTLVMDAGRVVADGETGAIFARRGLLRQLGLRRPTETAEDDWDILLVPRRSPPGPPIVELLGVEVGYGDRTVLSGLDLTLHEREFTALVGDNGSGKTTLARLLAGLVKPRKGKVRWRADHGKPGRGVGLVFQNPLHQLFCATVEEEVCFGPVNFGCFDPGQIGTLLDSSDLTSLRSRPVHALSSGQQQRTALAAVLSLRPSLIILDEPTMGQDWRHLSGFMSHLSELNRGGCAVLLISHDYKLVHRYAERVLLLRDGRIVADGRPAGPHRPMDPEGHHAV